MRPFDIFLVYGLSILFSVFLARVVYRTYLGRSIVVHNRRRPFDLKPIPTPVQPAPCFAFAVYPSWL